MKSITFLILVLVSLCAATPFCDGWGDGYTSGYCMNDDYCNGLPYYAIPICPIPNSYEDNYSGGFNLGFQAGIAQKRRDSYQGYRSLK
jgi:hypothetical protein